MPHSQKLVLPDLVSACPFKWSVHPDYERARVESSAWIGGFEVFTGRKRSLFALVNAELLPAIVNSYADYEEFRTCCDFNNLLFVVDEFSDELDGKETRKLGDVVLKALRGESTQGSVISKIGEE